MNDNGGDRGDGPQEVADVGKRWPGGGPVDGDLREPQQLSERPPERTEREEEPLEPAVGSVTNQVRKSSPSRKEEQSTARNRSPQLDIEPVNSDLDECRDEDQR